MLWLLSKRCWHHKNITSIHITMLCLFIFASTATEDSPLLYQSIVPALGIPISSNTICIETLTTDDWKLIQKWIGECQSFKSKVDFNKTSLSLWAFRYACFNTVVLIGLTMTYLIDSSLPLSIWIMKNNINLTIEEGSVFLLCCGLFVLDSCLYERALSQFPKLQHQFLESFSDRDMGLILRDTIAKSILEEYVFWYHLPNRQSHSSV